MSWCPLTLPDRLGMRDFFAAGGGGTLVGSTGPAGTPAW